MNDGGPAFPLSADVPANSPFANQQGRQGMSLRDWFAGQVLAAEFTGTISTILAGGKGLQADGIANDCYRMADAMLAERAKEKS